jgi:hypothetical protein
MILECIYIDDDGVETEIDQEKAELKHDSLAIIISHDERMIYLFKGADVSIRQKFASARKASALRLKHGYNIKHVEETEGIDASFKPILDYLGGIKGGRKAKVPATKTTAATKAPGKKQVKPRLAPPARAPRKTTSKATTTNKVITTPNKFEANSLEDLPPQLTKVVRTMMSLEPPKESSCDYVLVDSKLYIILGDNKEDLRKGDFSLEKVATLPEGVFPAENYFPRILVANQKVIGVELWKN